MDKRFAYAITAKLFNQSERKKTMTNGIGERFCAEALFSMEIWKEILKNVNNPDDLISVQKSSPHLRKILSMRTLNLHFEKVLQLIHPCLKECENLKCRLVSKCWKSAIDGGIEAFLAPPSPPHSDHCTLSVLQPQDHVQTKSSPVIIPFLRKLQQSYCFCNSVDDYLKVGHFLQHNIDTHDVAQNPFIGSTLSLSTPPLTDLDIFRDARENTSPPASTRYDIFFYNLEQMLEKYGSHISYVTIHISGTAFMDDSYAVSDYFQSLVQRLLPNLKKLRINGLLSRNNLRPFTFSCLDSFEIDLNRLEDPIYLLQVEVQPIRLFLESIHICGLQQLSCTWNIWHDWELKSMNWTALTELYLAEVNSTLTVNSFTRVHLPNLIRLRLKPALNKYGGGYNGFCFTEVSRILTSLGSRSRTLCSFVTTGGMPFPKIEELDVPQIRFVEIIEEMGRGYVGGGRFCFLVHFSELRCLLISWSKSGLGTDAHFLERCARIDENSGEDFTDLSRIIRGMVAVKEAKIWALIPNLERIYIKDKCHLRPTT